ncbi:hypothetical protein [Brevundimonas sp.]|uniref:hypothetical protein n=1 Tax=Brevundimonas sp. TaxID=1871086 RepID=UPI0028B01B1A|nr:hypothetical protein [Brevundimonas sp.]
MSLAICPIEAYRVNGTLAEIATVMTWVGEHLPDAEISELTHRGKDSGVTVLLKSDADVVAFKMMWADDITAKPSHVHTARSEDLIGLGQAMGTASGAYRIGMGAEHSLRSHQEDNRRRFDDLRREIAEHFERLKWKPFG